MIEIRKQFYLIIIIVPLKNDTRITVFIIQQLIIIQFLGIEQFVEASKCLIKETNSWAHLDLFVLCKFIAVENINTMDLLVFDNNDQESLNF